MKKIALDGDFNFTEDQLCRLNKIGEIIELPTSRSENEWLENVQGFDIICTWGDYVVANLEKLNDTLVTYPHTELGAFDSTKLAENNVFIANARGGNRKSVIEWTIFMIIALFRDFPKYVRTETEYPFVLHESIEDKTILIIGHGTIGTELGSRCEAFGMKVDYFNRGDDLHAKAKNADIVANCLNCNPSTKNFLDEAFFKSMKTASYYVSFARPYTFDIDGLIASINNELIAGAAIDCDPEDAYDISNDYYKKCLSNEKILVTPHIAWATRQGPKNGLEIMVQNIEAYLSGKPQNIIKK